MHLMANNAFYCTIIMQNALLEYQVLWSPQFCVGFSLFWKCISMWPKRVCGLHLFLWPHPLNHDKKGVEAVSKHLIWIKPTSTKNFRNFSEMLSISGNNFTILRPSTITLCPLVAGKSIENIKIKDKSLQWT